MFKIYENIKEYKVIYGILLFCIAVLVSIGFVILSSYNCLSHFSENSHREDIGWKKLNITNCVIEERKIDNNASEYIWTSHYSKDGGK